MKTVNLDTGLIAIILLSTFLLTTSFDGVETRHLERVSRDKPRSRQNLINLFLDLIWNVKIFRGLVNNEVWRDKGKSEIRAKKKKRNPTKRKKKRKKKRKNDKLARKFNNEINNYWKNVSWIFLSFILNIIMLCFIHLRFYIKVKFWYSVNFCSLSHI